jgi:hypothetical protein
MEPVTYSLLYDIAIPAAEWSVFAIGLVAATILIREYSQRRADQRRDTFELFFPSTMGHEQVLAFIRSLSGIYKAGMFSPTHTITFERYANAAGERFFMRTSGADTVRLDELFYELVDGSIEPIDPEDDPVRNTKWTRSVELGLHGVLKPLRILSVQGTAASLGAQFRNIEEGNAVVLQWSIFPDHPRASTSDDKAKVDDHTFHAIARVGVLADKPSRMLHDIMAVFRSIQSSGAKFYIRKMGRVGERINRRAGTWGFSILINATEISALMWNLNGTGQRKAKRLPPTIMHDQPGPGFITIGSSNAPKKHARHVAMPLSAFRTHIYQTGPSGSGKTINLQNITLGGINAGLGAFVFDPKGGDLVKGILRSIPAHRKDDVIWWDPMDKVATIGFNPLKGDPEQVAGHMTSVMRMMFKDSWGPRLEMYIKNIFITAATAELTMYDSYMMLVDNDYRKNQVLRKVRPKLHPDTQRFWELFDRGSDVARDTVINKLDKIVVSSIGRRVFSQQDGLNMADIMRNAQVLLVPMNMAEVGESNEAVGLLCQEMIINAAMRRTEAESQNTHLLVQDEYQHFAGISTNKFEPWAEVRSKGLGLVASNQFIRQLPVNVQETIGVNAATKIAFRAGDDKDAKGLAANFSPLTVDDMLNLPQYAVAARVMSSSGIAPVVTLNAPKPPAPTGFENYIIERSRRLYGRPVAEVDAAVNARHTVPEDSQAPVIRRVRGANGTP